MGKNQHVVKNDDNWSVKGEGNERATKNHETQKEAIEHASKIAQNQESDVIIHKADGEIRARKSFSNPEEDTTDSKTESDKSSRDTNAKESSSTAEKKSTVDASDQSKSKASNTKKSLWQRIKAIFSKS